MIQVCVVFGRLTKTQPWRRHFQTSRAGWLAVESSCVPTSLDEGDRFAEFAVERFGVALARGSFFGRARGLRIALGSEPAKFMAAIGALEQAAAAFAWTAADVAARPV